MAFVPSWIVGHLERGDNVVIVILSSTQIGELVQYGYIAELLLSGGILISK